MGAAQSPQEGEKMISKVTIIVTYRDIVNANHWGDFCRKYQAGEDVIDQVALNDTVSISMDDCIDWKISFLTRSNEQR
jgi:hypothetical protein